MKVSSVPSPPLHPDFLNPDEAAKIGLLMRMNFDTMYLFAMSRQERNRCAELLIKFYRLHIQISPTLNRSAYKDFIDEKHPFWISSISILIKCEINFNIRAW